MSLATVATLTPLKQPPLSFACFLPSCLPIGSLIDTLDPSAYLLGSMHSVQQHSA